MADEVVNPTSQVFDSTGIATAQDPQAPSGGGSGNMPAKLETMEDLKNYSPESKEVYDKMMLGIATNMVNEIKDHQERLKKLWREMAEGRR